MTLEGGKVGVSFFQRGVDDREQGSVVGDRF